MSKFNRINLAVIGLLALSTIALAENSMAYDLYGKWPQGMYLTLTPVRPGFAPNDPSLAMLKESVTHINGMTQKMGIINTAPFLTVGSSVYDDPTGIQGVDIWDLNNGVNSASWIASVSTCAEAWLVAFVVTRRQGLAIQEADMFFCANYAGGAEWILSDPNSEYLSRGGTEVSFKRAAIHELGHVLGLAHNFSTVAMMSYDLGDVERVNPERLTPDDLGGISANYSARPPNNTVDLAVTRVKATNNYGGLLGLLFEPHSFRGDSNYMKPGDNISLEFTLQNYSEQQQGGAISITIEDSLTASAPSLNDPDKLIWVGCVMVSRGCGPQIPAWTSQTFSTDHTRSDHNLGTTFLNRDMFTAPAQSYDRQGYITVCIDPYNQVAEVDESNNCRPLYGNTRQIFERSAPVSSPS